MRKARLFVWAPRRRWPDLTPGATVFELARVMGTSVEMIERCYGTLLDGSGASIATRLGVFEAEQDAAFAQDHTEAI